MTMSQLADEERLYDAIRHDNEELVQQLLQTRSLRWRALDWAVELNRHRLAHQLIQEFGMVVKLAHVERAIHQRQDELFDALMEQQIGRAHV